MGIFFIIIIMCQCDFVMWLGALERFAFWFSHLFMDMDVQILIVFNTGSFICTWENFYW